MFPHGEIKQTAHGACQGVISQCKVSGFSPLQRKYQGKKIILTLFVYLAMSAATSAEAVGIYRSVATDDDAVAVPKLDAAIMATEAGLLDTRVTVDVDVLSGVSFCCTARMENTLNLFLTNRWCNI